MTDDAQAGDRVGLIFAGAPRVPEMVRIAQKAEERGFESVWMAETRITRDAVAPVAAIAQATERIKVGTGIMNVYTRGAGRHRDHLQLRSTRSRRAGSSWASARAPR